MKEILKQMDKRIPLLKQAIRRAEKEIGTFPEGRLRISVNRGCPRYYRVSDGSGHSGEYISKGDMALVRTLAQKDYNSEFVKSHEKSWSDWKKA